MFGGREYVFPFTVAVCEPLFAEGWAAEEAPDGCGWAVPGKEIVGKEL